MNQQKRQASLERIIDFDRGAIKVLWYFTLESLIKISM